MLPRFAVGQRSAVMASWYVSIASVTREVAGAYLLLTPALLWHGIVCMYVYLSPGCLGLTCSSGHVHVSAKLVHVACAVGCCSHCSGGELTSAGAESPHTLSLSHLARWLVTAQIIACAMLFFFRKVSMLRARGQL